MTNQLAMLGLIGNWWLFISWTRLLCDFIHCIENQV